MTTQPRPLKILIQQFNRALEIDRFSKAIIGETYWAEVDGVRTRMVDVWVKELSQEEKDLLEAHMADTTNELARALGFENSQELFKDAGQKLFKGLTLGIQHG